MKDNRLKTLWIKMSTTPRLR